MMIYVLAMAMTVLMLIATVVGAHEEAQRAAAENRSKRMDGFGPLRS
ncbi:MAG: hypothetical protein J0H34_20515 [Rhizobiales bacterium]|nr:hypothetical protein [Hyphomicrobiales bacterium]